MPRKTLDGLIRRFGFPAELFSEWQTVDHDEDVFVATPEVADFDRLKPVRKGIRIARVFAHGVKPTTNAMQVFGRHATRNVVTLTAEQAEAFIHGETIVLPAPETADPAIEDGYVIVRHAGFTLGVGLYKPGLLKSQVPLSRRTTG
jgi:NOL1/NOP2/fmu family ribosome biogenesis protein